MKDVLEGALQDCRVTIADLERQIEERRREAAEQFGRWAAEELEEELDAVMGGDV